HGREGPKGLYVWVVCLFDPRGDRSLSRLPQDGVSIASFKQHSGPVTSVEWHPSEGSVLAAAGADDQITQWDLAVEQEGGEGTAELAHLPPQLLFIHQGQAEVKELHWHLQCPGLLLSTALSGFDVFRTVSV
ncbi:hypothetical protein chiPu_0028811, partial [Chiloscyllium punctatum]|nr:hypothetical protein [Chiloscyllium punctatum]